MSDFAGSLKLIEEGARVLTSVDPLLRSLPTERGAASVQPAHHVAADGQAYAISECESAVLGTISQKPLHIDAIVAQLSLSAQAVTAALLTLALENVVVEGPPGLFRRRRAL
jgi:DNA processing protein